MAVEKPRLHHWVSFAAGDVASEGAGLVVDVDEALFCEDARKQLPSRNRPDPRRIEIVRQWQAFDEVTEMRLDCAWRRQHCPAVEDEISEFGFPVDLRGTGCGDLDVEDALIGRFRDHRDPDIEQPRWMIGGIHPRMIVDLIANRPSGLCRLG